MRDVRKIQLRISTGPSVSIEEEALLRKGKAGGVCMGLPPTTLTTSDNYAYD